MMWGHGRRLRGRTVRRLSGLGEELLEERQGPRVVRLAQPEDRLLPDLGVLVLARDPDQGRNPLVPGTLGEREDRLPPHLAVLGLVAGEGIEPAGRRLARGLGEPEDRGAAGVVAQVL